MMPQQYCLRWKHHHSNVQNMFSQLLEKERFCDVTLYCSPSFATQVTNKDTVEPQSIRGVSLRAHRVVLAACSELLGALLGAHEAHGEPVLVIDGAEPRHLKALLDYMYTGEMNVHHSQLASLLKTAEELRIKGLTDIRWNNKDEPPDCEPGVVATSTVVSEKSPPKTEPAQFSSKHSPPKHSPPKQCLTKQYTPRPSLLKPPSTSMRSQETAEQRLTRKEDGNDTEKNCEKFNVNGGPPPLIKLLPKEKPNAVKREHLDMDSPSPKRQRAISANEHTDEQMHGTLKMEREHEWQHGNLDITAERVVGWGMGEAEGTESSREGSEDEWADAPTDIASFLHTKLKVDGDNSADEESNDSGAGPACRSNAASSTSSAAASTDIKMESSHSQASYHTAKAPGSKSGPSDSRFGDVIKLSDYLQHGRRPQFWEENYVKRVMESVRLKELEMKQAAEILGVSYGTLYGRYRDVYGCINRPYRAVRDFWQAKGPSEVLDRLQRGDISLDSAARALGVTMANLAAHVADFGHAADFEPIPIEVDPSLKPRPRTYSSDALAKLTKKSTPTTGEKSMKKMSITSLPDEDAATPAPTVTTIAPTATTTISGKWPSIRVASIDTLRGGGGETQAGAPSAPTSPSQLMRTRPDLTIIAARKPDPGKQEDEDT